MRKLRGAKHGFFLILGPDAKQEIDSCALKGEVWAMVLQTDIGSGPSCFAWHCDTAFQTVFRPLHELEELRVFWGSPDAAIGVHRLRLQIRVVSDVVTFKVRGLCEVDLPARAPRAASAKDASEDDDGSEALASDATDIQELLSDVDSDLDKLLDDEQGSDVSLGDQEEKADAAPEAALVPPKVARGSYVVYRSGYFTMINNPHFPDAKILLLPKWATDEFLGSTRKSKTLVINHYDGDVPIGARPVVTFLALRSWMLWRSDRNGFLASKTARRVWHEQETKALKEDIEALGIDARAKYAFAFDQIRAWSPSVL